MSQDPASDTPDLTSLSSEDFAVLVAEASDEQLEQAMTGPQREEALREIFTRMADHFDPARAGSSDSVVRFQILGGPDGGYDEYEVVIRDGACSISETPEQTPRVTLKVEPVAFLKLITNQKSGPELFMAGKLKIDGDLMFAPQIAQMFRIPTAPTKGNS